jgi:uncharacterized membrane protein
MVDLLKPVAEWSTLIMEVVGISIIALFAIYALIVGIIRLLNKNDIKTTFNRVRQRLGHGILLGLEFLVAADIIHTVAVELTLKTLSALAIIVLIRTFLSFTLEVELSGRWPWQKGSE